MADITFYFPEDGYISETRTALVTNASGTKYVKTLVFCNTSATAAASVSIHVTKASTGSVQTTLDNTNKIYTISLQPETTTEWSPNMPIVLTEVNSAVQAKVASGGANLVTALVTGAQ